MKTPSFRFFHDQLPDDRQRQFYDAVEAGIGERRAEISCPPVLGFAEKDYKRLLEHVYDDHPEYFSFFPLMSTVIDDRFNVKVRPFYRYSLDTQREYETALDTATAAILKQCFPQGWGNLSEIRREKILFDWITANVEYDQHSADLIGESTSEEEIRSVAWNAYGAMVHRKAVCEGIACAFKLLCDRVGLPSIVVLGQGNSGRHAWNMVRVNKKFYHVDCTWDLHSAISTKIPYARYRYFNLPDRIIGVNHKAESAFLPVCGSLQYNPFRIRKLCASFPAEVDRIALGMLHSGKRRFAVMTVGFRASEYAEAAAYNLARHVNGSVEYYTDDSNYFIGFVITEKE